MLVDEGLEVLTEEQCRKLLAGALVGRVGVTIHGLPVILPVNYAVVDGDVVFRTSDGTKLQAATEHAVIAFQVDTHDADTHSGWSVLAIGRSSIVIDEREQAALDQLEITPWAGGERNRYVRLRPELISGRRLAHA
jgi:nitroimidazol reductase NimA-like FMN-containing flavoprotein (pyridoxamine 5'-phosphate oxidase superfamily)